MNNNKTILPNSTFQFLVNISDLNDQNNRLDMFISKQFSAYSRSFFKKLIEDNHILVNGKIINKASSVLKQNDKITVNFPPEQKIIDIKQINDNLGIEIIAQEPDFLIVNKPAGIIVHAANSTDKQITLVDWLINKFKEISQVGSCERPGIVHRLDMNTSGLLIIPRNNYAHETFGNLFKNRQISKTYLAIVEGHPKEMGIIDFPIARHPSGCKMTAVKITKKLPLFRGDARVAQTNYKVLEKFKDYSLLEVKPITGRTHQIRVHLSAIGHPVIGDNIYGKSSKLISRHALHAHKLEFIYENQKYEFCSKIPKDFQDLINQNK